MSQDSEAPKLTVTITVEVLLPVPEESLESYLAYCEKAVVDSERVCIRIRSAIGVSVGSL